MVMSRDEFERAAAQPATTTSNAANAANAAHAAHAAHAPSPYEWTLEVRSAIALFCWWEPDDVGADTAPEVGRASAA